MQAVKDMAYPYPTLRQARPYVDMCILPHKVRDIDTFAECEAALSSCERQATKRYQRTGDASQQQFATLFNKAATEDRLVSVASTTAPNSYEYHGACKLLLSHQSKAQLWPAAAAHLEQNLALYHAGQPPASNPAMPTLACHVGANGRLVCDGTNFTQSLNLK